MKAVKTKNKFLKTNESKTSNLEILKNKMLSNHNKKETNYSAKREKITLIGVFLSFITSMFFGTCSFLNNFTTSTNMPIEYFYICSTSLFLFIIFNLGTLKQIKNNFELSQKNLDLIKEYRYKDFIEDAKQFGTKLKEVEFDIGHKNNISYPHSKGEFVTKLSIKEKGEPISHISHTIGEIKAVEVLPNKTIFTMEVLNTDINLFDFN